ncbi:MAG: glycosyltransferase [Gammaproteobacteria bacterium]|nr:glycosyltransferase [Gammaproteobacteria bacterium]
MVKRGHKAIVVSAGGSMVAELNKVGAQHVSMSIGNKSPACLLSIVKLRKLLLTSRPHILHARSRLPAWMSYFACSTLRKEDRPTLVTSVHGPYSVNAYSKIMLRGERVIAISEFIQRYISNNYPDVDQNKVRLVYRGINPKTFPHSYKPSSEWLRKWEKENPANAECFLLTLPARITRWKGQEDFIHLIQALKKSGANVHGLIVGGVEARRELFRKELDALVRKNGVSQHITFLGHRNDLKEIMSVSDLVLSLSQEPEAFGRTSLEALSLGKPVVAYDHGGASEVLKEIFPAGLVPALNLNAVIEKVSDFSASTPPVPETHSFTLQRMLSETIGIYEELASGQTS